MAFYPHDKKQVSSACCGSSCFMGQNRSSMVIHPPLGLQSVNTSRKEAAQRKEGKREGSKGSSHSEKMPGLGWGRTGPKLRPLRGAEKAGCFEAKVLL